jgi:hypothetical protein
MANTSYLRYTVEPWVRDQLTIQYDEPFLARKLQLSTGGWHEFDAVSEDIGVVGSIKAHSGLTSGGNHPVGKVAMCLIEVYYLTLIEAPTRVLILTDPEFYGIFLKTTAGKIAAGVDIRLMELVPEMQQKVNEIRHKASDEMKAALPPARFKAPSGQ